MSRWIALPAAAVLLLAAALLLPSLLRDRELVASTPSPRPLFDVTPVALAPNQPLCISDVTIPPEARQVRFQVITGGAPGPAIEVALRAPGYAQAVTVPAGYADETTLAPAIVPPATARLGEVCLTQRGSAPVSLTGTLEERTQSRPAGRIDGRPVRADTYLAFYEGRSGSPLAHAADMIDRMSAFRPGIVGPWLLWMLAALVVVGVPAGLVWALQRAARGA
jgi:hypothetical protein